MAELPIMPVKTDALLADTSNLTTEEFGAYCRLLFVMWRHGGRLVNEPSELARIAGVSTRRWPKFGERILRLMTLGDDGFISQKRLTDTWLNVREVRRKRGENAKTRWMKHRNRGGGGMQVDMQVHQETSVKSTDDSHELMQGPHTSAMQMDIQMQCISNANQIRKKERKKERSESYPSAAHAREGPPQEDSREEQLASPYLARTLTKRGWVKEPYRGGEP